MFIPVQLKKPKQIKRMTKLKTIYRNVDVKEIYFSDIKNELMDIEIQFISNHWMRQFNWHEKPEQLLEIQSLDEILKWLQKQSGQFDSGAGEIINSVLMARIKSLIVKTQIK